MNASIGFSDFDVWVDWAAHVEYSGWEGRRGCAGDPDGRPHNRNNRIRRIECQYRTDWQHRKWRSDRHVRHKPTLPHDRQH